MASGRVLCQFGDKYKILKLPVGRRVYLCDLCRIGILNPIEKGTICDAYLCSVTAYFYTRRKSCWQNAAGRFYSMYAPYFVEPVFKKEKQATLQEDGELEKITHVPIKAALNDHTCSVFHDELLRKFTNYVMKSGQRALARKLIEKAFENVKRVQLERYNSCSKPEDREKIETDPLNIMYKAVANTKPLLQLSPIKRGGVTYQVPVPITEKRSNFLAMKWLIEAANDKERTIHFPEKLAWELLDAAKNQGRVVKKKQDLHRQCEANRAYAHYRWS